MRKTWLANRIDGMYSIDDLLHLLHSDGADGLKLQAGVPPIMVLDGLPQMLDGAALTSEDIHQLWQCMANTRQRRMLRDCGVVEFIYRFRQRASFVVRATWEQEQLKIEVY